MTIHPLVRHTQDTTTHVTGDQMYEGDVVSSSYRDISLWVSGENIVLKGTRMTELIIA